MFDKVQNTQTEFKFVNRASLPLVWLMYLSKWKIPHQYPPGKRIFVQLIGQGLDSDYYLYFHANCHSFNVI